MNINFELHESKDSAKEYSSIKKSFRNKAKNIYKNQGKNINYNQVEQYQDSIIEVILDGERISYLKFGTIPKDREGEWHRGLVEIHKNYKQRMDTEKVKQIEEKIIDFIRDIAIELNLSYFYYNKVNRGQANQGKGSGSSTEFPLHDYPVIVDKFKTRYVISCKEYGYEFRGFSQWSNPTKLESEIVEQTGESANVTELGEKTVVEIPYNSNNPLKFVSASDESTQLTSTVTEILKSKDYTDIEWNLMDEGSLLKKTREGEPEPTKEVIDAVITERLK